jgi:hypothetical protein
VYVDIVSGGMRGYGERTYHLVVLFANLLAREFGHPVVARVGGGVGHEAWDDEGHDECVCVYV